MSQFKIYGHANFLRHGTVRISDAIHRAAVDALGIPETKRFHRFIALEEGSFITPEDRSDKYLIIECLLFEGRTIETKKAFYRCLLREMELAVGITDQDVEMTFVETPRHDWLIRGKPGDELSLTYKVDV